MAAADKPLAKDDEQVTISVRTKLKCYRDNRRYKPGDYLTYTGKLSDKPDWLIPREAPSVDVEFDEFE